MALSNYSELQASVIAWSSRSDLASIVPDCIALAEGRMNKVLRVRQMEAELSNTVMDNSITLDSNVVGVKALWIEGRENSPLQARPYEDLLRMGTTGTATAWAWQGNSLFFDGSGEVYGVVYEAIPTLSDANPTNWLLTAHPIVYLAGSLYEVFSYTRNMPQAESWRMKFESAMNDLNGGDMRDRFSGPLQIRAR
jgi:hypothetical protein